VFVGLIGYRCRDSCLTTVNRQSGQVEDDVADVIGSTVGSASICGNKNPGGSPPNEAPRLSRLLRGEGSAIGRFLCTYTIRDLRQE
jgi:hypothetical protein